VAGHRFSLGEMSPDPMRRPAASLQRRFCERQSIQSVFFQLEYYTGQVETCCTLVGDNGIDQFARTLTLPNMQVVEFSEAKDDLNSVLDRVSKDADYTIITRHNSEDAVVMSLETFNSHMETMHLLKSPANAQHLAKSIEQYKAGKVFQRELLDE